MATLPDPTDHLSPADRARFDEMASARSNADGRAALGDVYVRMFNNPAVATAVGALGAHLRFDGVLPDRVREAIILRYAARQRFGYEWAHHRRPAQLAGLDDATIASITAGDLPDAFPGAAAVLQAVDAVVSHRSIPDDIQQQIVGLHGTAGVIELVALCGLYSLMGYTVTAFDIAIEDGFPVPPF